MISAWNFAILLALLLCGQQLSVLGLSAKNFVNEGSSECARLTTLPMQVLRGFFSKYWIEQKIMLFCGATFVEQLFVAKKRESNKKSIRNLPLKGGWPTKIFPKIQFRYFWTKNLSPFQISLHVSRDLCQNEIFRLANTCTKIEKNREEELDNYLRSP